jgi:hypothetical protein
VKRTDDAVLGERSNAHGCRLGSDHRQGKTRMSTTENADPALATPS